MSSAVSMNSTPPRKGSFMRLKKLLRGGWSDKRRADKVGRAENAHGLAQADTNRRFDDLPVAPRTDEALVIAEETQLVLDTPPNLTTKMSGKDIISTETSSTSSASSGLVDLPQDVSQATTTSPTPKIPFTDDVSSYRRSHADEETTTVGESVSMLTYDTLRSRRRDEGDDSMPCSDVLTAIGSIVDKQWKALEHRLTCECVDNLADNGDEEETIEDSRGDFSKNEPNIDGFIQAYTELKATQSPSVSKILSGVWNPSVGTTVASNGPNREQEDTETLSIDEEDEELALLENSGVAHGSSDMIIDPPRVVRKMADMAIMDMIRERSDEQDNSASYGEQSQSVKVQNAGGTSAGSLDHACEDSPRDTKNVRMLECGPSSDPKSSCDNDKTPRRRGSTTYGSTDSIDRIRSTNLLDNEETIVDTQCHDTFESEEPTGVAPRNTGEEKAEMANETPDKGAVPSTPTKLLKTLSMRGRKFADKKNTPNKVRSLLGFVSRRGKGERMDTNSSPAMTEGLKPIPPRESAKLLHGIDVEKTRSVPALSPDDFVPTLIRVHSQDQLPNFTPPRVVYVDPPKSILNVPGRPGRKVAFSRTPLILQRLETSPGRSSTLHESNVEKNSLLLKTSSWCEDDDVAAAGLVDYSGPYLKPQDVLVTSHPIPVDNISFRPLDMYGVSNKEFDEFE